MVRKGPSQDLATWRRPAAHLRRWHNARHDHVRHERLALVSRATGTCSASSALDDGADQSPRPRLHESRHVDLETGGRRHATGRHRWAKQSPSWDAKEKTPVPASGSEGCGCRRAGRQGTPSPLGPPRRHRRAGMATGSCRDCLKGTRNHERREGAAPGQAPGRANVRHHEPGTTLPCVGPDLLAAGHGQEHVGLHLQGS